MHLGDGCFQEGSELAASRRVHRAHVQAVAKRKLGDMSDAATAAPPRRKRRRTKSFVTVMQIDHMLHMMSDRRLSYYSVEYDDEGRLLGDPWTLPGLSLSTDSGPDMVPPLASPLDCFL